MAIHHLSITLPVRERAIRWCSSCQLWSLGRTLARFAHLTGMNAPDHGLEPLMSVDDLAEYLGVPVQTIYDWRVAGTAPRAFKFGKRLKFAVADVKEWLAMHQETSR